MKTKIILVALLLACCIPSFAQFGPHRHHHHHPYYHTPYGGPYGSIEYRWGHYYDQYGYPVSPDYLGISLYGSEYLKARRQVAWGSTLTLTGAGMVLAGVLGAAMQSDYDRRVNADYSQFGWDYESRGISSLSILSGLIGAACLGAGIPLWVSGNRRFYRIADDYNHRYGGGYGYAPSLSLGSSPSGVGLSLRF